MNSEFEPNVFLTMMLDVEVSESLSAYTMIAGKRENLGKSGRRTLRLVAETVQFRSKYRSKYRNGCWAAKYRPDRRLQDLLFEDSICRIRVRYALKILIRETQSDSVRRIAIWFGGRCAGTDLIQDIAAYRTHKDCRMRKEVIRALARMNGWSYLREIERTEVVPRLRRIAAQKSPTEFEGRLSKFVRNTVPRKVNDFDNGKLWLHKSVKFTADFYPKSIGLIRFYLKRISKAING